jgi:hypothetical protein
MAVAAAAEPPTFRTSVYNATDAAVVPMRVPIGQTVMRSSSPELRSCMMRLLWCLVPGSALLFVTAGCSKKAQESPRNPEPVADNGRPKQADPGAGNLPQEWSDPFSADKGGPAKTDFDSVLAMFRETTAKYDPRTMAWGYALRGLRKYIPPDHPRHAEVFHALVKLGRDKKSDPYAKDSLLGIATEYAGKDEVPEVVALVDEERNSQSLYAVAIKRLKELKDPSCIPAAVRWWTTRSNGRVDAQADALLRALGPAAEKAIQPYAAPNPPMVPIQEIAIRRAAISLLADIGTANSLPVLQSVLSDKAKSLHKDAQAAMQSIQKRIQ